MLMVILKWNEVLELAMIGEIKRKAFSLPFFGGGEQKILRALVRNGLTCVCCSNCPLGLDCGTRDWDCGKDFTVRKKEKIF